MDIKCICISLKECEKERILIKKEVNKLGLDVDYHIVNRSPLGSVHGCFTCHIEALKSALRCKDKYIMILEDDAYFDPCNINKIYQFIETLPKTCWCFAFGYLTSSLSSKINKNIHTLTNCQCAHAYLVPRQTAKRLINMQWNQIPYDYEWNKYIDIFYVPYPMIAFQRDHPSSIQSNVKSYVFNTLGYRTIANLSETWSNYAIIIIFFIVIFLIIIYIMIKKNYYK